MRKQLRIQLAYLMVIGLALSLLLIASHGFSSARTAAPKEVWEPITAATASKKPGMLAWLESFLPDGIRLTGTGAGLENQRELLATADCFNSGAGISCRGFASLEEYVAAVRVSEDLGIPIQKLKDRMRSGRTLAQTVQELHPGTKGRVEVLRAKQQARKILKDFSS